jgi:peptidoglycan/xylan/chitin deacetylase (PgdA/CDA1 family)
MIGQHTLKRMLKKSAGGAAVLMKSLSRPSHYPHACILFYHRVADLGFVDPHLDDWNVPPSQFERQIAALAEFAEIVPLLELPKILSWSSPRAKPIVALTFDDGYANFYTQALPVLQRYNAPATLFVVTSTIGRPGPMTFDRWSQTNKDKVPAEAWQSINWRQLEECLKSGIIGIGAHSHYHLKGSGCGELQLIEEATFSSELLRTCLGVSDLAYAYPYGNTRLGHVSKSYVKAVREAGFQLAVTTDLGLATPGSDIFRLPRIEAHALDGPATLQAKANGMLAPYHLAFGLRVAT